MPRAVSTRVARPPLGMAKVATGWDGGGCCCRVDKKIPLSVLVDREVGLAWARLSPLLLDDLIRRGNGILWCCNLRLQTAFRFKAANAKCLFTPSRLPEPHPGDHRT
jgi:hypothetical protein